LEGLRQELDEMTARVRQVMKQTRARIFRVGVIADNVVNIGCAIERRAAPQSLQHRHAR
jgi:hypothetical protein